MIGKINRICIVGAGFGGITAARVLKSMGYMVSVYDKEAEVGGVWTASRRYPGLTTQNPASTYCMSDFPMPKDYPEWPTGKQVQEYMQSYCEHYGFTRNIHLNTEVTHARYDKEKEKWVVSLCCDGKNSEEYFDYLIVANGIFSVPNIPDYPGMDGFIQQGGTVLHTSEFTDRSIVEGKHVLVVGYGKSSCDVANAIADAATSTHIIARSLLWKLPRRLGGFFNYKHLFLTRLSESLFRYIRLEGFDKFMHGRGQWLRNGLLNSVQWVIEKQLKLKAVNLHPEKPLETIARSTVSLSTDGLYKKIEQGKLSVLKSAVIDKFEDGYAYISTGEKLPADVVICGTGWKQQCTFLDDDIMEKVTDDQGNFRLYRSMIPIDVPRLAFNGYNSSFFSQLNCEVGALWLADYLGGGIQLPSVEDQNDYADKRLAWMEARTDGKHSKGTNIIPFSIYHIDELLDDMNLNVGPFLRFRQYFGALKPGDYDYILPKLSEKYADRKAEVGDVKSV